MSNNARYVDDILRRKEKAKVIYREEFWPVRGKIRYVEKAKCGVKE